MEGAFLQSQKHLSNMFFVRIFLRDDSNIKIS
jgi:hypothetical protein